MSKFLVYRTQTGALLRARVVTRHRDGDFTVEPWFYQQDGKDHGAFQGGHRLRVGATYITTPPA
jgi:hypothetical protein